MDLLAVLKALGDETRFSMYQELASSTAALTATELAERLGLHANTVRLHLERLREVKSILEDLGYHIYLVREEPDRPGETVMQKVLRFALSSKFLWRRSLSASISTSSFPPAAIPRCVP